MLFVVLPKLLKLCGAIHNFDHPFAFVLRRIEHSLFLQLSDCAADVWVISLFYNTLTPTEYLKVPGLVLVSTNRSALEPFHHFSTVASP
jgi:hypothetical protein